MVAILRPRPARGAAFAGMRRRDLFILPAIFVLTPALLLCLAEAVFYYPFYEQLGDSCIVTDPVVGHRARPGCVSTYKVADSPWIENRYNDCGYRTAESCGPKPAGTLRAAVIGSSIATGYMVRYGDMFPARAAADLARDCRRPVEFQDLGGIGYQWGRLYEREQEALALKPGLLVMTVTPYDLMQDANGEPAHEPPPPHGLFQRLKSAVRERVKDLATWRALLYAQALNPRTYLRSYLAGTDNSGYLRTPWSPRWQDRIGKLTGLLGRLGESARAAGVPFVLLYVPPRPQLLVLGDPLAYHDLAPAALQGAIGAGASRAGMLFIDMTRPFQSIRDVDRVLFVMSDHPTGLGHRLMADALVASLLGGKVPGFAGCSASPPPGSPQALPPAAGPRQAPGPAG